MTAQHLMKTPSKIPNHSDPERLYSGKLVPDEGFAARKFADLELLCMRVERISIDFKRCSGRRGTTRRSAVVEVYPAYWAR